MAELLLHVALVDLGRRGQAGTQRVARELFSAFDLGEVGAHAGSRGRLLDEARHFLIEQPVRADILALAGDPSEERTVRDPCKVQPGLQRDDRAGRVRRGLSQSFS